MSTVVHWCSFVHLLRYGGPAVLVQFGYHPLAHLDVLLHLRVECAELEGRLLELLTANLVRFIDVHEIVPQNTIFIYFAFSSLPPLQRRGIEALDAHKFLGFQAKQNVGLVVHLTDDVSTHLPSLVQRHNMVCQEYFGLNNEVEEMEVESMVYLMSGSATWSA